MRVSFVSLDTIHHRKTETNERIDRLQRMLVADGHEVHVYCAQWWDGRPNTFEHDGIVYHGLVDSIDSRRAFTYRLPMALRSVGPDVVHAVAEPPGQVLAARAGASFARAPLFVEWYGAIGAVDDRHHRWAARRSERIVTPSRMVRTWVRELGVDGERVEVVPNPIDLDRIRSAPIDEGPDVVTARRLDADANVESLLLGLAELRGRDWSAMVIGDGPERESLESLASDLRIDDRVSFVGERPRDERLAAYRGAHVFVQTAKRCVFPTELLWALAAGCVGIVEYQTSSSAHELVEGRTRGFRTTDAQEMADAILQAGELERRDLDEAFSGFDRDVVLERYLDRYEDERAEYGLF